MSYESKATHAFNIQTEQAGEATVVRLSGHVDELGADALSSALDKIMEDGNFRIVFDLTDVLFMSSTGLGQIMRTYRSVRGHDGYVRIANPQPLIADIFAVTKLNKLLNIYPSVEDALRDEQ